MKIYAKVIGLKQGKQVIKGQGSNQSLQIEVLTEGIKGIPSRANQFRLSLNVSNDNELQAELLEYSTGKRTILVKGEKQKGEVCNAVGCSEEGCGRYLDGNPLCAKHAAQADGH